MYQKIDLDNNCELVQCEECGFINTIELDSFGQPCKEEPMECWDCGKELVLKIDIEVDEDLASVF
jgi:hypothetical protein